MVQHLTGRVWAVGILVTGNCYTMTLKLTQEEKDRLIALNGGKGTRGGKRLYARRPEHVKITAEQVRQVRACFRSGMYYSTIMTETGLSEFIIRGVKQGRYDFLVDGD